MPQKLQPTHPEQALSVPEDAVLRDALGTAAPVLLYRSGTRVDTGRWLGKGPLWVCLTESAIVLMAASKRRSFHQQMPLSDCKGTQYCHTSGALLLQPSDKWRFNTIVTSPADGLKVLQHIEAVTTPSQPLPVTEPTGA